MPKGIYAGFSDGHGGLGFHFQQFAGKPEGITVKFIPGLLKKSIAPALQNGFADAQIVDALRHASSQKEGQRRGIPTRHPVKPQTREAFDLVGMALKLAEVFPRGHDGAKAGEVRANASNTHAAHF